MTKILAIRMNIQDIQILKYGGNVKMGMNGK